MSEFTTPASPFDLPIAAAQGFWVRRRRKIELPEAAGPRTGVTAQADHRLRLAVLGESSAAGCGAESQEEAFAGHFARALAARESAVVEWTVHAKNGATAKHFHDQVLPELTGPVDVAVLMIGANDVLQLSSEDKWARDLHAILERLDDLADQVIVTGIPPFEVFPLLPRTLSRAMGKAARKLDRVSRSVCARYATTTWIDTRGLTEADPSMFARDGFHPSPLGYQRWSRALLDRWAPPTRTAA